MALLFSLAAVLIICSRFQYKGGCKYCVPLLASMLYILTRFTGSSWIKLVRGGDRWEIRVKGNLSPRPDNGRINSSPIPVVSPVYRLQHGATYTITIPGREASSPTSTE